MLAIIGFDGWVVTVLQKFVLVFYTVHTLNTRNVGVLCQIILDVGPHEFILVKVSHIFLLPPPRVSSC